MEPLVGYVASYTTAGHEVAVQVKSSILIAGEFEGLDRCDGMRWLGCRVLIGNAAELAQIHLYENATANYQQPYSPPLCVILLGGGRGGYLPAIVQPV